MTSPIEPTRAAGGIVTRDTGDGIELLVAHRPRYDDWSLPKGHLEVGETALEAALREVQEETGYECAAQAFAGIASYTAAGGEPKVVHYWLMTVIDGTFAPNEEVDRVEWTTPDRALALLTYDLDRDLIRSSLDTQ